MLRLRELFVQILQLGLVVADVDALRVELLFAGVESVLEIPDLDLAALAVVIVLLLVAELLLGLLQLECLTLHDAVQFLGARRLEAEFLDFRVAVG